MLTWNRRTAVWPAFVVVLVAVVLIGFFSGGLIAAWNWYSFEVKSPATGSITHPHADLVNPIGTFVGALGAFATAAALAYAAIRNALASNINAAAANLQANTASKRHQEQTDAERKRRTTEGYSTAVSQLAGDKVEERLGGIYSLEQISKESHDYYWLVMETLTAFVRERTRRTEDDRTSTPFEQRVVVRAYFLWGKRWPTGRTCRRILRTSRRAGKIRRTAANRRRCRSYGDQAAE